MKKCCKLVCCIMMIVLTVVQSRGVITRAQESKTEEIDNFLLAIGMSEELIHTLPQGQKEMMYQHLDENAEFCSYTVQHLSWDEGELRLNRSISESDMTISLAVAKTTMNLGIGEAYIFFPSFVWHTMEAISNDSFSFSLYPGWEVLAAEDKNLEVWLRNQNGDKVHSTSVPVTSIDDRAMSYKIKDVGTLSQLYEGHAIFYAKAVNSNATPTMTVHYFHDETFSRNIRYSILLPSLVVSGASSNNYDQQIKSIAFKK